MDKFSTALETSLVLYLNWKCLKKLYQNQFDEVIEPYRREILKKCDALQTREITRVLFLILKNSAISDSDKDFILYSAAAADIILQRKMQPSSTSMSMLSRN